MNLTNQGLRNVEACAEMSHNAEVMLMCQILREIREIKDLFHQGKYSSNGGNNGTSGTDNGENKRETFEKMTARFNNSPEMFICTEALSIFYKAEREEIALDALKILERAAQI